jgi:hypothetical protein
MKTRLCASLGAFAAVALVVALSNQGLRHAIAEENVDPQGINQQDNLNQQTDLNQQDSTQVDVDAQHESGQLQTREYGQRDTVVATERHKAHKNAFKASELIGMNVRGRSGDDDIGQINDLMISKDGRVIYAAVSFGGFLGLGDKLFAVPLQAIDFVKTDDESYARMDVTEQTLENKEGFNQDNWPQQANRDFVGGLGTRQAERPETDADVPR